MPGALSDFLQADHARLDEILTRAAAQSPIDLGSFNQFREGLLRHIAMEEKVLLPDARRRRGGAPLDIAKRLKSAMAAACGPVATLESIASEMRMSPRTLQRRLTTEGTTFARVYETVREELARAYVADAKMPLTEIAFLLGYAELSAFLRAFKRWTGKTPSQFRE